MIKESNNNKMFDQNTILVLKRWIQNLKLKINYINKFLESTEIVSQDY